MTKDRVEVEIFTRRDYASANMDATVTGVREATTGDAADVARCLDAISRSLRRNPIEGAPGRLHHGVVHERGSAFAWLVHEV